MKNLYETFLRWLCLWLPEDSRMREHLTESSYEGLDGEFWMAIAPELEISSPWDMAVEVMEDYLAPFPMEMRILESTQIYLKHYIQEF